MPFCGSIHRWNAGWYRRFFREVSPATSIIGVDAHGSVIFGTPPAPRKLTGIGSSKSSSFITRDLYSSHMLVRDEEAFAFCRALSQTTGIKVERIEAAQFLQLVQNISWPTLRLEMLLCVCADGGDNYADSIFNDGWIQNKDLTYQKSIWNRCKISYPTALFSVSRDNIGYTNLLPRKRRYG